MLEATMFIWSVLLGLCLSVAVAKLRIRRIPELRLSVRHVLAAFKLCGLCSRAARDIAAYYHTVIYKFRRGESVSIDKFRTGASAMVVVGRCEGAGVAGLSTGPGLLGIRVNPAAESNKLRIMMINRE